MRCPFCRRSAAKLSYAQAQAAIDGVGDAGPAAAIREPILKPLWAAWAVLEAGRNARSPLELDLPERKIVLGPDGKVARITVPERLAAHRLIEEFMIQANVAAAETLEAKRTPSSSLVNSCAIPTGRCGQPASLGSRHRGQSNISGQRRKDRNRVLPST